MLRDIEEMTNGLTEAMLGGFTSEFLRMYAPEFYKVLNSRDIKKVVRWVETKHREVIAPYKKEHPIIAAFFEELVGEKIGESLGKYVVREYDAAPSARKEEWDTKRWLHHGAIGELLVFRGLKKGNRFLVGLGNGLMNSDLEDKGDWHSHEYWKARQILEKMP
jgi:Ni,Fe-hydrogenase I large subunit